jgi:hypothetical protein
VTVRLTKLVACGAAFGSLLAACGNGAHFNANGTAGAKIAAVTSAPVLNRSFAGLTVTDEDVSQTVKGAQRAYVDALSLYGLRSGQLLEATLQVAEFNPDARYQTPAFRTSVVNQIGSVTPVPIDVNGTTVYASQGSRQRIFVWFAGRNFFVLAVRQDYPLPRTLLREALQVVAS